MSEPIPGQTPDDEFKKADIKEEKKSTEEFDEQNENLIIEKSFKEYENTGNAEEITKYFGNFYLCLPGVRPQDNPDLTPEDLAKIEEQDRTPSLLNPKAPIRAQLYEDTDKTIEESGLNVDEIKRMLNGLKGITDRKLFLQKEFELHKYIAPLYIALQKKGYNRRYLH